MERMLKTKKKYLRAGFEKSNRNLCSVKNLDGLVDSFKTELIREKFGQTRTMPKLPLAVEMVKDDKKTISIAIKKHMRAV